MEFEDIRYLALLVYKRCEIRTFPFDCIELLDKLEIKHVKYSQLSSKKQQACLAMSDSAFLFDGIIFYNDLESDKRIRFSLMHELGHIVLQHNAHTDANEKQANFFAKNMLAPPMAIHYSREYDVKSISLLFDITLTFSQNALNYYKKWHKITESFGMGKVDKEFYKHFYNDEFGMFVVNERKCKICSELICNTCVPICKSCEQSFVSVKACSK